jgi:hypothetical protein
MNAMKMEHDPHILPHTTSSLNVEDACKVEEVTCVSSILNLRNNESHVIHVSQLFRENQIKQFCHDSYLFHNFAACQRLHQCRV